MPPSPDMVLTSDASREGWGATCKETRTGGMWSVEERLFHINYLELKAAFLAHHVFASQKRNAHIMLRIDNTTAIVYVNKRGDTLTNPLQPSHSSVGVVPEQEAHDPGRAYPGKRELGGRQGIQEGCRLQQLDATTGDLQGTQHQMGQVRCGPLCGTTDDVLQLSPGPTVDALSQTWTNLRHYVFQTFRQSTPEDLEGEGTSGGGDSSDLAEPTLVPSTSGERGRCSNPPSPDSGPASRTSRRAPHHDRGGPLASSKSQDKHH